jgi:membrane protease YdiL (CAAX protease family)
MAAESKTFPKVLAFPPNSLAPAENLRHWALWLQVGVVYALIVIAAWTPQGMIKGDLMLLTAGAVVIFALCGRYTARAMGLGMPSARGSLLIMFSGLGLAMSLPLIGTIAGLRFPPVRLVPWNGAWQYSIWALMQQFALQSFFYLRIETLFSSRRAVIVTALLFSSVHLPSPVLTVATLVGGLFFCEMFRRYRTIVPLGLVHALLGLTLAASFSDHILHHMRVGIGYLTFHP